MKEKSKDVRKQVYDVYTYFNREADFNEWLNNDHMLDEDRSDLCRALMEIGYINGELNKAGETSYPEENIKYLFDILSKMRDLHNMTLMEKKYGG